MVKGHQPSKLSESHDDQPNTEIQPAFVFEAWVKPHETVHATKRNGDAIAKTQKLVSRDWLVTTPFTVVVLE